MSNEKVVVVSNIPEKDVPNCLKDAKGGEVFNDISQAVIKFTRKRYSWFEAEYAFVDNNIIVHFYPTGSVEQAVNRHEYLTWWTTGGFPTTLDRVARAHFDADRPRLIAKYTPEVYSWWLRAQGFANRIDPAAYTERFFETLDAALGAQ